MTTVKGGKAVRLPCPVKLFKTCLFPETMINSAGVTISRPTA